MNSSDLTMSQAQAMRDRLRLYLRYLRRVKTRMDKRGFPLTDELLRATNAAYDTAHALTTCLHYLSFKSGVGRPARDAGATTDGKDQDDLIASLRPPLGRKHQTFPESGGMSRDTSQTALHPVCGFRPLDPVPSDAEIARFYESHYFDILRQGGRAPELRRILAG